jgi:cardiolipin synthase
MFTIQVYLLALMHLAPATWSVYHILLYKRDPRAAMGWIIACIFVPFAGPIAYFLFGINRVRSRARDISRTFLSVEHETGYQPRLVPPVSPQAGLRAIGERVTGRMLSSGNSVVAFHNGENAYPAMIRSINAARDRILLATYILKTDKTGIAFSDALAAAVKRGVKVWVLVDGIGELYSRRSPSKFLRKRGIKVARFLPPKLIPPSVYLNLRNHRKMLVIDQDIVYAGGMNISDDHIGSGTRSRKVNDIHFGLRGPIVNALAEIFHRDWHFTTADSFPDERENVANSDGDAICRAIPDGPDAEMDALALTIQTVVSAATDSIDIMTPYFLPGRELIASLQSAALRGVAVRIVLPAENNLFYVHWANRNMLAELLKWGIQVHYQPPPFCHSKLLCIDDEYCLIGSANLDPRSLRLNYELGIEVFSERLSAELRSHIESVIDVSSLVTPESLANRSVPVRLRDGIAGLFSPYL